MKTIVVLCLSVFTLGIFAQEPLTVEPQTKKWSLTKIGLNIGGDRDMLNGLSHQMLVEFMKDPLFVNVSDLNYSTAHVQNLVCENPAMTVSFSLEPKSASAQELRLAASFIFNKVDAVFFGKNTAQGNESDLTFKARTNEIDLEATYLRKIKLIGPIYTYLGAGANIGKTFNGKMRVQGKYVEVLNTDFRDGEEENEPEMYEIEYLDKEYDTKNAMHQRVYLHGELAAQIGRIEIGGLVRVGKGFKWMPGNEMIGTTLNSAFIAVRYSI